MANSNVVYDRFEVESKQMEKIAFIYLLSDKHFLLSGLSSLPDGWM